ncbi:MAG: hypothetical protein Q9169_005962 [Polycauliona sp. 2 TL-2023]
MHHITTSHRSKPQLAGSIVQSPAFFPPKNDKANDATYAKYLELTKARDFEALLEADTKTLQEANAKMVFGSKYGSFNFGPTIDHYYVDDVLDKMLAKDRLQFPPLLLGHEKLDGLQFTPPWIRNARLLKSHLSELFPDLSQELLQTITLMYPIPEWLDSRAVLTAVAELL